MNQHNDSMDKSGELQTQIANDANIAEIGNLLFSLEASIKQKESALHKLAHAGTEQACKILKAYKEYPDEELRFDAEMAHDECSFFLHCSNSSNGDDCYDDDIVFTGVGKNKNMMRIYYMVLPQEGQLFEAWQHDIIRREMSALATKLECEGIERFDCQPHYVGLILLQSHKVSMSQFIDTGIAACNAFGDFVLAHYYAGTGTPTATEIDEIIEIVRYGDDDED